MWHFLGQKGFQHATDEGYWGRGTYFSVSVHDENFEVVVIYTLETSHKLYQSGYFEIFCL